MATKFKVGDILIGNSSNDYVYTNRQEKAKVVGKATNTADGSDIRVELTDKSNRNRGPWDVKSQHFDLVRRAARKSFTLPQYAKAVVLDNDGYAMDFQVGDVVILDLHLNSYNTVSSDHDEVLVKIVGSNWGSNKLGRFAIDPLIKINKTELKELIHG